MLGSVRRGVAGCRVKLKRRPPATLPCTAVLSRPCWATATGRRRRPCHHGCPFTRQRSKRWARTRSSSEQLRRWQGSLGPGCVAAHASPKRCRTQQERAVGSCAKGCSTACTRMPHQTKSRGARSCDRMAAAILKPLVGSLSSLRSPAASMPSSRKRAMPLCLWRRGRGGRGGDIEAAGLLSSPSAGPSDKRSSLVEGPPPVLGPAFQGGPARAAPCRLTQRRRQTAPGQQAVAWRSRRAQCATAAAVSW